MVKWAAVLLILLWSCHSAAERLNIAVAANFKPVLKKIKADFERRHHTKLSLSSASTGVLYAQIVKGAPIDIFLAADQKRPMLLEQRRDIVAGSRQTYATGVLVLWHATGKPNQELLENWQEKIAIANPKTAPYGQAAKTVLEHLGLWQSKRRFLVRGANIAQAFQFIGSGNVRLGFVALSQLSSHDNHNYWILPESWYNPIEQQAVILKRSNNQALAQAFMNWLMSSHIQSQIQQLGYAKRVNP